MADQTTRRRGLRIRDDRREAVADLRVSNQFQQPVRALQPRGANQREDMRATAMGAPPANRPLTRYAGGHTRSYKSVGGHQQSGPRRLNVQMGGQFQRRNEIANQGRDISTEVHQTLAQQNPNYDPQAERRFGPHGLTFDQLERVHKFKESQRTQRWMEEKWANEFERDNAKTRAQFEIDRRRQDVSEERFGLDTQRQEFDQNKARYDAMTAAEQKAYDRKQSELNTRRDAFEKDRNFRLKEAQEARLTIQAMKPEERKDTPFVTRDNEMFFASEAENSGYEVYDEEGVLTIDADEYLQTLDVMVRSNPEAPLEELIPQAAERAGLMTPQERSIYQQQKAWIEENTRKKAEDPKAWKKRRSEIEKTAEKVAKFKRKIEGGDKRFGFANMYPRQGVIDDAMAYLKKLDVPQPDSETAYRMLPVGTHYIDPEGNIKIKSGSGAAR